MSTAANVVIGLMFIQTIPATIGLVLLYLA